MNELLLPPNDGLTDAGKVRGLFRVDKFYDDDAFLRNATPFDSVECENLFMYGGVSCLWQGLLGNITATAGQALTRFDNANAAIGVGDSTTAVAATDTDLQAATNKLRKAMDATFPQHTDGVVVGAASIVFQSTFGTAEANWAWQELGIFNSPTAATGRMLDRVVSALGTKTSASSWQVTATLTLT